MIGMLKKYMGGLKNWTQHMIMKFQRHMKIIRKFVFFIHLFFSKGIHNRM